MRAIDKLAWNTQIVDPETGTPNQFFILAWQTLLSKINEIELPVAPTDGDVLVLTYSAEKKKWIGS